MGRGTKLNPDTQTRILRAIRRGYQNEEVAAAGGIHSNTLYNWIRRGREALPHADGEPKPIEYTTTGKIKGITRINEHDRAFVVFLVEFMRARLEVEGVYLDVIRSAAVGGQLIRETTEEIFLKGGGTKIKTVREWSRPDPKAAQWYLERAFRRRWAQSPTVVLTLEVIDAEIERLEAEGADPSALPPIIEVVDH